MNHQRNTLIVIGTLFIPLIVIAAGYAVFSQLIDRNALAEPPLVELARDDFETFDMVWQLGHGWQRTVLGDGEPTAVLAASGSPDPTRFGDTLYGDVVVQVRFWVDAGEARLDVRRSPAGVYSVGLGPTGRVRLYRDGEMLAEDYADAVLTGPPWHTVRFAVLADRLDVRIDGEEMFLQADTAETGPLPPGLVTFSAGETPASFYVDDFVLLIPAPEPEQTAPAER